MRTPSTSGGRPIPPRSELRNSTPPTHSTSQFQSPTAGGESYNNIPPRSAKRNSNEFNVQPLNTGNQTPVPPPKNNDPISPVSPVESRWDGRGGARPTTPNYSRPGVSGQNHQQQPGTYQQQPSQAPPPVPSQAQAQPEHMSKRQSLGIALKGLHGAGEAIRGTVNTKIAHGMHDTAEEERMKAVREQGINEFRGSGLYDRSGGVREGFREKSEVQQGRRLRKRSLSRGPQLGHGLDAVDERPTP